MSAWFPAAIGLLAVLGGIVLTHSLFLYVEFYRESRGYILRAIGKVWPYLFMFFTLEWIFGSLYLFLTLNALKYSSISPLPFAAVVGIVIGVIMAAIPIILETRILPKNGITVEKLQSRLVRLVLKLNFVLRYNFAWAIESSRQQDVYDSQTTNAWGLDLTSKEIGRRLRILYELYKFEIAERRKDPSLLYFHDKNTPWAMFYVLVRHLGRKELREALRTPPPSPSPDWDGRERRRRRGTKADRTHSDSPDFRSYDYPLESENVDTQTDSTPESIKVENGEQEQQSYRALAATWPVGPTILQILNGGHKKANDLKKLLPEDDIPAVISILEAANLIKARADEIENPEQRVRFYGALKSLVPGPEILHTVATQPEWINNSKYVSPSDGVSAVFFNRLRTSGLKIVQSKNQHIEFTDFYFELSDVGKSLLDKLLKPLNAETKE